MSRNDSAREPQTSGQCPVAGVLANHLRAARLDLTAHWLDRIAARVRVDKNRIFPTDELLDHVPILIDGIAGYLQSPASEVSGETPVVAKAMELGQLRHAQGFDAYQIMKEYEILGGILFAHLARIVDDIPEPCTKSDLLWCGQRLFKAIVLIQQATTTQFLRMSDAAVADREGRLRAFNRSVSHEIKNRVGTILGASATLLDVPDLEAARRQQFVEIIARNAREMTHTIENLVALSRTGADVRQHRHVQLPEAAQEARRQIRDAADAAGVEVTIGSLPSVDVNAAAVELCLTNYLSNAIKYTDPKEARRAVVVDGSIEADERSGSQIVVRVRDNGIGVSESKRASLFQKFYRANDTPTNVEGTGLGLSIVAETVESLGGRAWAEFPEKGSMFMFALPCRRAEVERRTGAADPARADSPPATAPPEAGPEAGPQAARE